MNAFASVPPLTCLCSPQIAGVVRAVGDEVKDFKVCLLRSHCALWVSQLRGDGQVGDMVGVGCFVKCCEQCDECKAVSTPGDPLPVRLW